MVLYQLAINKILTTREVEIAKATKIVFKTVSKTTLGGVVWTARVGGATELEIV